MGANRTEKAIQQAAKATGKSSTVVDNFVHVTDSLLLTIYGNNYQSFTK